MTDDRFAAGWGITVGDGFRFALGVFLFQLVIAVAAMAFLAALGIPPSAYIPIR